MVASWGTPGAAWVQESPGPAACRGLFEPECRWWLRWVVLAATKQHVRLGRGMCFDCPETCYVSAIVLVAAIAAAELAKLAATGCDPLAVDATNG